MISHAFRSVQQQYNDSYLTGPAKTSLWRMLKAFTPNFTASTLRETTYTANKKEHKHPYKKQGSGTKHHHTPIPHCLFTSPQHHPNYQRLTHPVTPPGQRAAPPPHVTARDPQASFGDAARCPSSASTSGGVPSSWLDRPRLPGVASSCVQPLSATEESLADKPTTAEGARSAEEIPPPTATWVACW